MMDYASFQVLRQRIVLHEWVLAGADPELGADRSSAGALTRAAHRTKPVSAANPTLMAPSVVVLDQPPLTGLDHAQRNSAHAIAQHEDAGNVWQRAEFDALGFFELLEAQGQPRESDWYVDEEGPRPAQRVDNIGTQTGSDRGGERAGFCCKMCR